MSRINTYLCMCSLADSSPGLPQRGGETRCWPPSDCSEPVISDHNTRLTSRLSRRAPRCMQTYCNLRWRRSRAGAERVNVARLLSSCRFLTAKLMCGKRRESRRGAREGKKKPSAPVSLEWESNLLTAEVDFCSARTVGPSWCEQRERRRRTDYDVLCALALELHTACRCLHWAG